MNKVIMIEIPYGQAVVAKTNKEKFLDAIAWIEDFSRFDLNYLFLWIFIGMCYSPVFRNMSNNDFRNWLYNIIR